ncbi:MAG: NYN domain-containing protein [Bacillota bacterium]|nr:NYN domain-containing protein [Bacillota bacterium]
MPEHRIACFIDGGYLDKSLKDEFNSVRIDYAKLSLWMARDIPIYRTYYYNCLPYQGNPPTPEESERYARALRFYDALERLDRFEIRRGKLKRIGNDFTQKGVDVYLAIDLIKLSTKGIITHASVFTGDSDFLPVIQAAKEEGIIIYLYYSQKYYPNTDLWKCCDERRCLTWEVVQSILR